jgi:hypothetical protein
MLNKRKSLKEVLSGGQLKRFIDPRLIKAIGHPIREHALAVFNERVASATEIGEEIDLDTSAFYHHIQELEAMGCIERVETRRRRGAKEHFFQATTTAGLFDDRLWSLIPKSLKSDLATGMLRSLFGEAVRALRTGTFNARDDRHLSWTPGLLDSLGWQELMALLEQTLKLVIAIQRRSRARIAKTGEPGIPVAVGLLGFETASEQFVSMTAD